ncbi:lytic murein transglycosylase [Aurantiacibacter luteus]|uniref:Lytic transglycosylase n=1 Tax=Aurantiacibacter luteus TaxID=1581420 RepID=A0A0G9MXW9_9SPHN|nr:lytic murein transglycosylase [Aurantiacibacter luteus]KLE35555.1 lytic transglycosylase [Aurantiacibacter luteus]
MTFPAIRRLALSAAALLACASPAAAQNQSFDAYLQDVARHARAEGVSQSAINSVLGGLTPNQRVIELDRDNVGSSGSGASNSFPSMANYIARHNTQARIDGGRRALARIGSMASRIEREYGVPAEIVVAIWGHETSYGAVMGGFDLPRSLATLAWEGRRRELFEQELIDTMKMVDRGVRRDQLVGSWAGAFGNGQFLPSIYLRLAVDGDGDGDRDVWNSDADSVASIANYFRDAGWRSGQPWAVRAYVPNSANRAGLESSMNAPICPRVHDRHSRWLTVREWRERGVQPQGYLPDDALAALFEPDGPAAPGYLLTQNYRVILEYNCSNYYAMSVGLLADEIAR